METSISGVCQLLRECAESYSKLSKKKIQEKTSHHIHVCLLSCFVLVLWMDLFQFTRCQKNVFLWCTQWICIILHHFTVYCASMLSMKSFHCVTVNYTYLRFVLFRSVFGFISR